MSVNQNNNMQDLLILSCLNDFTNCLRQFHVDIIMLYISAMNQARKLKFSSYVQLPWVWVLYFSFGI